MRYFERQQAQRRHADRRRSAADGHGAVGDASSAASAGIGRRACQRTAARPGSRPSDRRGVHPPAHGRLRRGAADFGRLLARARRADHRRARSVADRSRHDARHRRPSDDADRAWSRATGAGRQQHARATSTSRSRSAAWGSRSADTARSPGRATARAGASTVRKRISCPVIAASTIPPLASRSPTCGDVPAASIPGPGRSAVELIDSIGADDGIRALLVMGSNLAVSAPDGSAVEDRLKALDLLVVCDFFLSETAALADVVLPVGAVGRRRGHDDQSRGSRDPQAPCDGSARRRAHRSRRPDVARRAARQAALLPVSAPPGKSSTSSVAPRRGAPADYSGITYERIDAEDGVFWPCPASIIQARRVCSPTAFPRQAAARSFMPCRTCRPPTIATTSARCI